MTEMTNLESSIRDLVAANEGFWLAKAIPLERRTGADHSAIAQWGKMLKSSQEYLGIVIVDYAVLDQNISEAEQRTPSGGQ